MSLFNNYMNIEVKRIAENKSELTISDLEIFHTGCGTKNIVVPPKKRKINYNLICKKCSKKVSICTEEISRIISTAIDGKTRAFQYEIGSTVICKQ